MACLLFILVSVMATIWPFSAPLAWAAIYDPSSANNDTRLITDGDSRNTCDQEYCIPLSVSEHGSVQSALGDMEADYWQNRIGRTEAIPASKLGDEGITAQEARAAQQTASTSESATVISTQQAINLQITTSVPSTNDYDIELYGPSGAFVKGSYKGIGQRESITYTATTTGTYYVKIYGYPIGSESYNTTSSYTLTYNFSTAGNTPPSVTLGRPNGGEN